MTICLAYLQLDMLDACRAEAECHYPLESGGTLMGYTHDDYAVVETLIPAGPKARRSRHGFAPDQAWQLAEIARCYEQSGRRTTYLGDWHSHPNALSGELSGKDKNVVKRVIKAPGARCPRPLMAILWGTPASSWTLSIWSASLLARPLFGRELHVDAVQLIVFD